MEKETIIQDKILKHLTERGVFCFRVNNTPIFDRKLNNGYGAYRAQGKWSAVGLSDIIAVINGQFIAIEVKTPRGVQSADQMLFQRRVERAGGRYLLVRSIEDLTL